MNDIPGILRVLCGYSKIPNKNGNYQLAVEYQIASINLSYLQKLFNIDPNDEDHGIRDLIDCYEIDEKTAKTLQPYVKEKIDLDKYSFMLQATSDK